MTQSAKLRGVVPKARATSSESAKFFRRDKIQEALRKFRRVEPSDCVRAIYSATLERATFQSFEADWKLKMNS